MLYIEVEKDNLVYTWWMHKPLPFPIYMHKVVRIQADGDELMLIANLLHPAPVSGKVVTWVGGAARIIYLFISNHYWEKFKNDIEQE